MKCTEPCVAKTLSKHSGVKGVTAIRFLTPPFPAGTVQSTFKAVLLVARRKPMISPLSRATPVTGSGFFVLLIFFLNKKDKNTN